MPFLPSHSDHLKKFRFKSGIDHLFFGKTRPNHSKIMTGKYRSYTMMNCSFCSKSIHVMNSLIKDRKFCNRKCFASWLENQLGPNAGNWKGGINSINNNIRKSARYKRWRNTIFKRDDYTCGECGLRGVYIEAHHIKPFSKYPNLRFDLKNGISLCKKCHNTHKKEAYIVKQFSQ